MTLNNNDLSRFDNRVEVERTATVRSTGCQTALYNRFDNRLYTRYSRLSNQFENRLDNRFDNRLYRVNGALECRSEMCRTRLAGNTGRKNRQKFAIWAPLHNFVGLYLRNYGTYRQSAKIVKHPYLRHMPPQSGELRPTNG